MHAVVGQVNIDQSREEEARKALSEIVVPTAKAMPGFVGGTWCRAPAGRPRDIRAALRIRGSRASRRRADAPRPATGYTGHVRIRRRLRGRGSGVDA